MLLVALAQVEMRLTAALPRAETPQLAMHRATQLVQPLRAATRSRVITTVVMSILVSSDAWRWPAMAVTAELEVLTTVEWAAARAVSETPMAAETSAATSELRTSTAAASSPVSLPQLVVTTSVAMPLAARRTVEPRKAVLLLLEMAPAEVRPLKVTWSRRM